MMSKKLNGGQKNLLRLIKEGQYHDGWCHVSNTVYPVLQKKMPPELVEHKPIDDGWGWGWARLTEEGEIVVRAMKWL